MDRPLNQGCVVQGGRDVCTETALAYGDAIEWYAAPPTTTCPTEGGDFTALTGCVPRAACSTYTCPTGYKADASAAATLCVGATCGGSSVAEAASDTATCCSENECTAMDSVPAGYTFANAAATTVTGLGAMSCVDATHIGTPATACDTDGGVFTPSGCFARAACSTASCPSGYKANAANDANLCLGAAFVEAVTGVPDSCVAGDEASDAGTNCADSSVGWTGFISGNEYTCSHDASNDYADTGCKYNGATAEVIGVAGGSCDMSVASVAEVVEVTEACQASPTDTTACNSGQFTAGVDYS